MLSSVPLKHIIKKYETNPHFREIHAISSAIGTFQRSIILCPEMKGTGDALIFGPCVEKMTEDEDQIRVNGIVPYRGFGYGKKLSLSGSQAETVGDFLQKIAKWIQPYRVFCIKQPDKSWFWNPPSTCYHLKMNPFYRSFDVYMFWDVSVPFESIWPQHNRKVWHWFSAIEILSKTRPHVRAKSPRAARQLTVDEAIGMCFPEVLLAIICQYAAPQVYEWMNCTSRFCSPTPIDSIAQYLNLSSECIVRLNGYPATSEDRIFYTWYTFVTDCPIRFGARSWTIAFSRRPGEGEIGAGVTTSWRNFTNSCGEISVDCGISRHDSWIVRENETTVSHRGEYYGNFPITENYFCEKMMGERLPHLPDSYIEFVADRDTLRILGRMTGERKCFVLMTAKSVEQFDLLRPCVVLAGRVEAVILSGKEN